MAQKNYYQLLQVNPHATAQEIKAAYRKMVFRYHPDRNKGNALTEVVMRDINEAYGILSDNEKRRKYNASIAIAGQYSRAKTAAPVTSHTLVQNAVRLKLFVEKSNVLSINQDLVFSKVEMLLSDFHLHILLVEDNRTLINQFVHLVLFSLQPLPLQSIQVFYAPLQKLAGSDAGMLQEIQVFYGQKKGEAFWQRYKIVAVFIITCLLCLLIYLL